MDGPLLARTSGPYYGNVDTTASLTYAVHIICGGSGSELVLLHGDHRRLRLMVNLIAQLNTWNIYHIMFLGFDSETCAHMKTQGRIGCVTSSHLDGNKHVAERHLEKKFVAWLQRFQLLRRLFELERPVNILALDTDMALRAHPYETLHRLLGSYTMVTTFDFKGGFANTNIGWLYLNRNGSKGLTLRRLFAEFERRIDLALPLPPDLPIAQRRTHTTKFLWDQNLWNKVCSERGPTH